MAAVHKVHVLSRVFEYMHTDYVHLRISTANGRRLQTSSQCFQMIQKRLARKWLMRMYVNPMSTSTFRLQLQKTNPSHTLMRYSTKLQGSGSLRPIRYVTSHWLWFLTYNFNKLAASSFWTPFIQKDGLNCSLCDPWHQPGITKADLQGDNADVQGANEGTQEGAPQCMFWTLYN